jgi:hypothetical protein
LSLTKRRYMLRGREGERERGRGEEGGRRRSRERGRGEEEGGGGGREGGRERDFLSFTRGDA